MEVFGIKLLGVNPQVGEKLLFTVVIFVAVAILRLLLLDITRRLLSGQGQTRTRFWTRQTIILSTTVLFVIGMLSLWFDNPSNLGIALGLVTAGLAFASQKVIVALAGYLVVLRGNLFDVGDRVTLGGATGDVLALDFLFTTILEIGAPSPAHADESMSWVRGRQHTGRIVSVSNGKIFDDPVFNYSRDFPYIWDEIHVPIAYADDAARAETILLDAAVRHTESVQKMSAHAVETVLRRYAVPIEDLHPRVFYRITDNWLELSLRFLAHDRGIRSLKDAMTRDILRGFAQSGLHIASATYDIVGFPPLRFEDGGRQTLPKGKPERREVGKDGDKEAPGAEGR